MKRLLKDRTGGITIFAIGLLFVLLLIALLVMEMGAILETHDYAMSVLQRSCNIAVEENINEGYRADHVLALTEEDQAAAKRSFIAYVQKDLPSNKYEVYINPNSITFTSGLEPGTSPSMTASGTIILSTMFSQYGFEEITVDFTVRSTNYNTTDYDKDGVVK